MSEATKKSLEGSLQQLKCHFTWNLIERGESVDEFEDRVFNKHEFQSSEFKATMFNLSAYLKHCRGQNEAALECLQKAEESIQREYGDQAEIRRLVTWGNYAWVYYHMGQFSDAQTYVNKVKRVCAEHSSPYRIESPELDCEEGWACLKCTKTQNERAKICFEKALDKVPQNPEFTCGWTIASSRLEYRPLSQNPIDSLWQAIELNPNNQYIRVLLALKLQKMNGDNDEEESLIGDLENAPTDVLCSAAKFYRSKGDLDEAIRLLRKALEDMPDNAYLHYYIGCCYRSKVFQRKNEMGTSREELLELAEQAVHHLKKADESNGNLLRVCGYITSICSIVGWYEEAEHYFQKEFCKELQPPFKQLLHLQYGNFQWYQMECEEKAIYHFIEGVKIDHKSVAREKMKGKLQKLAQMRLSKNKADPEALHILTCLREVNGEMQRADEDSENDLESGIHLVPLDETENEE